MNTPPHQQDNVGSELAAWDEATTANGGTSWGSEATEDLTQQCEAAEKLKRHQRRQQRQNRDHGR